MAEDKAGLERSVLTYVDISCQAPAKFYLIIDETYGKALFTVDSLTIGKYDISAYRDTGVGDSELVTSFSPSLPWRMVNKDDVYIQTTREVMQREGTETKDIREFRTQLLKELGMENLVPGGMPEGVVVGSGPTGQYL